MGFEGLGDLMRSRWLSQETAASADADSSSINAASTSSARTTETLSVTMRVHNPDSSAFKIESRDPAHAESGFFEIFRDDFQIFHKYVSPRTAESELMRTVSGRSVGRI
jgi:hypothetical protein